MSEQFVFCYLENGIPSDYFPIGDLRPNCDRFYFDSMTGESEGLLARIERMEKAGYRYMALSEVLKLRDRTSKEKK